MQGPICKVQGRQ